MTTSPSEPAAPPADPPGEKPESDKPTTEYLILEQTADDNGDYWTEGPKIKARGANAAIRKHVEKAGEGTYVAVPTRSWEPVTVKTETQTKLVFS